MGVRRKAREAALQIVYQAESQGRAVNEAVGDVTGDLSRLSAGQLSDAIDAFFEHFSAPDAVREQAAALARGTHAHVAQLDEVISQNATNWKISRMAAVDRNILRLAAYEMQFGVDLSAAIIIDEAIEIAKRFGTEQSGAFVHAVLDGVGKTIRRNKAKENA